MLHTPDLDLSDLQVDLTGQTALVTGGASGIGRAIAERFAAAGARVAVVDRDQEAAEEVAAGLPGEAFALPCDVTATDSVRRAVAEVMERTGQVDVCVNSAGVAILGPAESLADDAWEATLAVNLSGTYRVCREVGAAMLERGRGRIINLASQAASVGLPEHVAYCASKSGLLGMTRVLALEWGGRGVTVNTVSPTVVLTPLGLKAWEGPKGEAHQAEIPVGRFAQPEEIAAVALFLASSGAAMINGADLVVDGGFTVR